MLKCYVLDDEQQAVDALTALLKKKCAGQVVVSGSNIDPVIAIEEIEMLQPDVLFLDVEMPAMNGLDVLKHFPHRNFRIIFTTAHEKYALPAIKAAAMWSVDQLKSWGVSNPRLEPWGPFGRGWSNEKFTARVVAVPDDRWEPPSPPAREPRDRRPFGRRGSATPIPLT